MALSNQEGAQSALAGMSGHSMNNDHLMNIDSLQQNVIAQKNTLNDAN